jgi:ATP-binding cassette subfamily B protein/subfamily B ATP-binding cassette protein MsbA
MVIPNIKDDFLMQFGIYFVGGLLIIKGSMTIGALLVFVVYYKMLSNNLNTVSGADADLQSSKPFYERVLSELQGEHLVERANLHPQEETGKIVLENITFGYPESETNVFKDFSLTVNPGERVAITGASGAGKTTLVNIIMGILEPQSGNVTYSRVNVDEIDLHYLYGKIGYIMQQNLLFNLSIRENLLLAKSNAGDTELDDACRKAYILDFIESLPDKYETIIGERGVKLSGGQRQRLVLARLFLRDVDVLIFDEATSSLDQYSEAIIQKAIDGFGRETEIKTLIVIAHRESSTAICERKVELKPRISANRV